MHGGMCKSGNGKVETTFLKDGQAEKRGQENIRSVGFHRDLLSVMERMLLEYPVKKVNMFDQAKIIFQKTK